MNILIVSNKVPYPLHDGGAIATFSLLKAYEELGHNVSVLAMSTKKHPVQVEDIPSELKKNIKWFIHDVPAPITAKGAFINLFFSSLPYNAARFLDYNFACRLQKILEENSFDIVQFEGLYVCHYVELVRHKSNAKVIYRAHNVESEIWRRRLKQAKGLEKLYIFLMLGRLKKFEKSYANRFNGILPISERDSLYWQRTYLDKSPHKVTPTGISPMKNAKKSTAVRALFHLGALDWHPNIEGLRWFFKECWPQIVEACPDVVFHIAGRNGDKKLLDELSMYRNVELHGEVDDASSFMSNHGIMLVPLLSGGGMRIKIVEGLSLACPIISTSIGAEGIDVKNDVHLNIANHPEEFIATTIELLNNNGKAKLLGEAGQEWVENELDNLKIAENVIQFYEKGLNFEGQWS
ncbi:glycosyltransferase [Prolixibacteraceae bacterium JC049]|nr:glycosyltransferase [Prolixibacteraceae bacterium JC049]